MDSGAVVTATVLKHDDRTRIMVVGDHSPVPVSEFLGKAAVILLYVPLLYRIVADIARTGRVTAIFLLVMASSVVLFTLLRRSATRVDRSWTARAATLLGTVGPLLFRPGDTSALPDVYTALASLAGFSITLAAVLVLRRSFGLIPAHRGIVTAGPYKFVRHPIYAGYLIVHAVFVLAYPTMWNLIVWIATDSAMLIRLAREECLLSQDAEYTRYSQQVRWRVVPGLF